MAELGELGALVVEIRATRTLNIDNHLGRALQQLCLDSITKVDAPLARHLHNGNQIRAYTVAGPFGLDSVQPIAGRFARNAHAWLRLTALSTSVLEALDAYFMAPPAAVEIDRVSWELVQVRWAGHPWAGRSSYAQLIQSYRTARPPQQVSLRFRTPTGFHSNGSSLPLPLPRLVFGSLEQRWTALTGTAMPELLGVYADNLVEVRDCQIRTQSVSLKNGSAEVGFVGDVLFTLAHANATLSKNQSELAQKLVAARAELARAVGMLSEFAFFSGVGIKTAVGMGMVRLAEQS